MTSLEIAEHPLLDVAVIVGRFPQALGALPVSPRVTALLSGHAETPLSTSETVKRRVRDLLRGGGYQPTGRGKPSAEYLCQAVANSRLGSINLAVDMGNAVSLHSGLPISVLDLDLLQPPLSIEVASADAEYVFNASGQVMALGGLLCLCDAHGPCGNAVKDSQRTKTSFQTRNTLSVIWGTVDLPGRTRQVVQWYLQLMEEAQVSGQTIGVEG